MATATPTTYAIEIRDKDDELKQRIEHRVTSLSWEWKAHGGCGRCNATIEGNPYLFEPAADDNILIYLPAPGGGAELWYRGYIESFNRTFAGPKGTLSMEFEGLFGWMNRLVVHENVGVKVYEGMEMSAIVDSVFDEFIAPQAPITKGTIDEGLFSADRLEFKNDAEDVLRTLADLQGRVIYGVGPDGVFYWRNESDTVGPKGKWFIGDHITGVRDRTDYRGMKNEVFFEGGKIAGAVFSVRRSSTGLQALHGVRQILASNSSINTNAVSARFIKNILLGEGVPRRQVTATKSNVEEKIEASIPIGPIEIIDPERYRDPNRYRADADPDGILYGVGDHIYGETEQHYVERVRYTLSPDSGNVDAEIQFGDSQAVSMTSARIKQLENEISNVRRSL